MATTDNQVIIDVQVDYGQAVKNIAELKSELDRLRQSERDLNQQREVGLVSEERWRLETARNAEQQKRIRTEIQRTSREIQQATRAKTEEQRILQGTAKTIDIANASYNELSRTYTRMKDRINQMSAAQRSANQAYIRESQQVYERMKLMQAETGRMQLNVGNYENAILSALGANGRLSSMLMMGGTAGGTYARGMGVATQSVKAFGTALWSLMANPAFLVIAGVAAVGAAFKFWADYNDGIAEATRLTREFVKANGIEATTEQIANMRAEIQAIADVYGKEYKETLQGVDTLMSQFGIDAKTALDIVAKGFAAGADLNGDFLAQVKQYAPAFRDAGVSAEELVALIQQTRSGLFSKDGMDVITKAGMNLRKMSNQTRSALQGIGIDATKMSKDLESGQITMLQAIQQVSKGLQGVGVNSREAGAVISDVFGKKGTAAGQQMIRALADMNASLDKAVEQTGKYGELQMQIVESQKELNRYTEALFGSNGWETLKQQAELYWNRGLTKILQYTVGIANSFIKMYNNSMMVRAAIQSNVFIVQTLWEVFSNFFKGVARGFHGLAQTIEGLNKMDFGQVGRGIIEMVTTPAAVAANIAKGIREGFRQATAQVSSGHLNEIDVEGSVSLPGGTGTYTASGGSSTTGGGSAGGKGGGKNTAADNAKKQADELAKLEKQLQQELTTITIKAMSDRRAQINAEFDKRIADTEAKYAKLGDKVRPLLDEIERERTAALAKYDREQVDAELQQRAELIQAQMETFDIMADNETLNQQQRTQAMQQALSARLAALAIQQMQERRQHEDNAAMLAAIDAKYLMQREAAMREYTAKAGELEKAQVAQQMAAMEQQAKGYSDTLGAMSSVLGEFSDQSKEAAIASKVLAVAQVAIEQGVAIAKATSAGAGLPFPANLAAIASGIAAVVSSILSATKAIGKAKFADGGLVEGAGTGTSDSIPAMLSNGESVITARGTRAFAPLLSSINMMGGGVPISVADGSTTAQGEAMLSRSFANALRDMPSPVVAVSEIERVGARVKVIENFSQL